MLGDPPPPGRLPSHQPGRWVSPMLNATISSLLAHCARPLLTTPAIMLDTGLMADSFVFVAPTDNLDALFAQCTTGSGAIAQHAAPQGSNFGAGSGESRPVHADIEAASCGLNVTAAADGVVSGRAVVLGRDGRRQDCSGH